MAMIWGVIMWQSTAGVVRLRLALRWPCDRRPASTGKNGIRGFLLGLGIGQRLPGTPPNGGDRKHDRAPAAIRAPQALMNAQRERVDPSVELDCLLATDGSYPKVLTFAQLSCRAECTTAFGLAG